ncbi:hypothetical protein BDZ94DRAFT_1278682 [Collybia nuda]|uniref:Uncharacterized protein n=1 Tax=Collybia nuda TaxID=64659 RepID=A0A9P6CBJ6_9AGAR|nr:hypothetical protein BDZ94DRAFT_1278682 [Collybia nuda]
MSGGYDTTLMSIDHHSWAELLLNVIRIDIAKPELPMWPQYVSRNFPKPVCTADT